jgi:hypothetical protein
VWITFFLLVVEEERVLPLSVAEEAEAEAE